MSPVLFHKKLPYRAPDVPISENELSSSACVTPARHACVEPSGPHLPSP